MCFGKMIIQICLTTVKSSFLCSKSFKKGLLRSTSLSGKYDFMNLQDIFVLIQFFTSSDYGKNFLFYLENGGVIYWISIIAQRFVFALL